MGILIGWIIQKRWLTVAAFVALLIGSLTVARLPAPISYVFIVLPALFLMAVLYNRSGQPGLKLAPRVRLAWVLWMGFSTAVLTAGFVLGGSNKTWFVASVAVFVALTMPSIIAVRMVHQRRLREEQLTKQAQIKSSNIGG